MIRRSASSSTAIRTSAPPGGASQAIIVDGLNGSGTLWSNARVAGKVDAEAATGIGKSDGQRQLERNA